MDLYWKQYSLPLVFDINIGVSLFYISIFKIVCRNVYYWWAQNFSNTMIWVYLLVHITHVQYNLVNVRYFDSSSKFWSGPGTMKCRRARFWSQSQFSTIYFLCKVRLRSKLSLSKFYGPASSCGLHALLGVVPMQLVYLADSASSFLIVFSYPSFYLYEIFVPLEVVLDTNIDCH